MRAPRSGWPAAAAVLFLSIAWPASGGPGGRPGDGGLVFLGSSLWTKAHDVEVRGGLAYCAFLDGLQILDLSDPRDPEALSTLHLGGGFAVALAGDIALVAAADKGLALIDVRDPKAPVLKSMLDTPGEAREVEVKGPTAFVADGAGGLLAVDIADPAAPKIAGSWDSPGEATGLMIRGETAFLADGSAGLQIVDIARPSRPLPVGSLDTDGTAETVALSGNTAYVADGSGGIKVVDVASPAEPKLVLSLVAAGYARSVAAEGKLLCVGSLYDGGYQVFDISDPRSPAVLSTNKYTMYNEAWRVVLREGRCVVVD
ncbi:MAG: repeat-containing protein [Candidatus Aminicenantes bacterium]|nr:repeat-containing protein [Candidatus Aminicenantes bacterium]